MTSALWIMKHFLDLIKSKFQPCHINIIQRHILKAFHFFDVFHHKTKQKDSVQSLTFSLRLLNENLIYQYIKIITQFDAAHVSDIIVRTVADRAVSVHVTYPTILADISTTWCFIKGSNIIFHSANIFYCSSSLSAPTVTNFSFYHSFNAVLNLNQFRKNAYI